MKTTNKCLQTLTTPALKSIINNKTTLFLIVLFLLFKQTIQSQTNFTENFSSDSNTSYVSLDWLENNSYTDNLDLEENSYVNNKEIVSDTNETNNTTQLHYIVEQEFTTTLSLENIEVSNQPFPNPDSDGDGVDDAIDLDDDNDGVLDTEESETNTSSLPVFNVTSSNSNASNTATKTVTGTFSYGTIGEGTWVLTTDAVNYGTQQPNNFYINAGVGSNKGLAIIVEGSNYYSTSSTFTYSISTADDVFKDFQFQLNGNSFFDNMNQNSDVYNLTFPLGSNGIILDPDNQTTSDDGIF